MPLKLHIIICSTRPGRVGPYVAKWFHEIAVQHGEFEAVLIDLAEFNLPVYDEPEHPVHQRYRHEHTKNWAASVNAADAYVFITPEYNYGPPPSLLNALNYVYKEWNYKPAGFVSYGGVSGGLRAALIEKLTLTTLKIMPIVEAVTVQNVSTHIDENKHFIPNDHHISSGISLLNELHKWAQALKMMRQ
ncbi:NADPH-dependent FMN reductase [Nitrosomonas communis]|uniref:NAD(P)H-dependent FMN reductase n=1 Tax=Nitrosomonas communis TaxID=44574 RepID=A0A1H2SQR2_9PROT|nr:NAD(P)H-dependent oxidoreductase [Nitrosomonas communis]SDW34001.1 NAD(P)H-dependent FMN reductase [Nitrosomonas communis]